MKLPEAEEAVLPQSLPENNGEKENGGITMVSEKVVVKNPTGLHLRPAGALCKEAMNYTSSVKFRFNNTTANAKSVLSVLGACIKTGDELEFICEGPDEEEALKAVVELVKNGLGE